ncbi:SIR2 family NAD-dependent protein deacylase [Herbidospora sp. RD11066]
MDKSKMEMMEEADWDRLIYQLERGLCTPFVGAGASLSVLPSGRALSRILADRWGYTGKHSEDLPHVIQFGGMKFGDLPHVKEIVRDELDVGRVPDFTDPHEPHGLLAGFDLPIFLTTNFDDFIARSLMAVGKTPTSAICPWNSDIPADANLVSGDAVWKPEPNNPLVYHLHGALTDPGTLVLAEDDYHEFIWTLSAEAATGQRQMLPPAVLKALTRQPLLFMGYSLQDLSFRILFRELNKTIPGISKRKHVSIQLEPATGVDGWGVEELMKQLRWYYGDWKITVYWGGAAEFCAELRDRMAARK